MSFSRCSRLQLQFTISSRNFFTLSAFPLFKQNYGVPLVVCCMYLCRINDFEFTRKYAIFNLLDIDLHRGWIVDPQVTLCDYLIHLSFWHSLYPL